jgi:DMSO reductase anchor subunit
MHPAFSVIFFTAVSGTGYGLLCLIGLAFALDPRAPDPAVALPAIAIGAVFAAAGLTSSMLHLGQPQRAWRAFSQWRSSWLSREGVAAMLSFVPTVILAALVWRDSAAPHLADSAHMPALRSLGIALAVGAAVTVLCTARIYTSLRTIPAWSNGHVLPGYLLLGLLGGAAWLWMIAAATGAADWLTRECLPIAIAVFAASSALVKRNYWRDIDSAPARSTAETATGLGLFGSVHGVEAPHTEENYLTREMGFVLARKHAARLRVIALALLALLPVMLAVTALMLRVPQLLIVDAVLTVACVMAGTFVERWLFFAEAKHVVMLYYAGARG